MILEMSKEKCTAETTGKIVKKKFNDGTSHLTVEYYVDGKVFKVTEQLTFHITKVHKIGMFPIGYNATAAIENTEIGAEVRVRYNPNKPKRSYLPDNNGHHLS